MEFVNIYPELQDQLFNAVGEYKEGHSSIELINDIIPKESNSASELTGCLCDPTIYLFIP